MATPVPAANADVTPAPTKPTDPVPGTQLVHAEHMTEESSDLTAAAEGHRDHEHLDEAEYLHLERPAELLAPSRGVRASGTDVTASGTVPILVILTTPTGAAPSQLSYNGAVDVMNRVTSWMTETSHGLISAPATVTPFLAVAAPSNCNNPYSFLMSATSAARNAGYNYLNYAHVVAYTPGCWSGGLGEVGGSNVWIYNYGFTLGVLTHELGHNFGLYHANTWICPGGAAMAANDSACAVEEYGDNFSTMGAATGGHYSAYEKEILGWLSGNRERAVTSGTYDLVPISSTADQLQALRLRASDGRTYWVEYRAANALDSFLSMYPQGMGVQIRYQPANPWTLSVAGGLLLDTRPSTATFNDASIPVGNTWTDTTGSVNVRVVSVNASSARVEVQGPTGRPSAPSWVESTPGDGQVSVAFATPTSDGGAPITSYTVHITPNGGTAIDVVGSASPIHVTGLRNGITHSVSVTASNSAGAGSPAFGDSFVPQAPSGTFTPILPLRLADTRATSSAIRTGSALVVPVQGTGLPTGTAISAVSVNVTATNATGAGFLTAYPCGQAVPSTSTVNFAAGETAANASVVPISNGSLCLYGSAGPNGRVDAIVDVTGWYNSSRGTDGARFNPVSPTRLEDTRDSVRLEPGDVLIVQVGGRDDLPSSLTGAVMTLTAVDPQSDGYLTAYPCDRTRPSTSSVNYNAGEVVANTATVGVSSGGAVCIYTYAATDVVVDLIGWFGAIIASANDVDTGTRFTGIVPQRVYDTRNSSGALPDDGTLVVAIAGRAGVPVTAVSAVAVNVTVVNPSGDGYATVFPCNQPAPLASTVNYATGETVANATLAAIAGNGTICVKAQRSSHIVVDVTGWFG